MNLPEALKKQVHDRKANGNLRYLYLRTDRIDFLSNDYLGLARSKEVHEQTYKQAHIANGAGGSRLLAGNSSLCQEAESYLASIFDCEATLIYTSGYAANLGILCCVPQRGDTILFDELSHASIKDGMRLSLATRHSFKHNDLNDLERKLSRAKGNTYIVVEAIYSMDGDACPLEALTALARQYQARIILDEAHSTGLLGPTGGGLSMASSLHKDIFARIYTFGKAMGIHGACIAGSQDLQEYLINFSRPFIYTTALPPTGYAAIKAAFEYLTANLHLQKTLQHKVKLFINAYQELIGSSSARVESNHPIQSVLIPGNDRVNAVSKHLRRAGYEVRPITSPTVKEGGERLRICLHSYNLDEDILALVASLAAAI